MDTPVPANLDEGQLIEGVNLEIVEGQVYGDTIQVSSSGLPVPLKLDQSQQLIIDHVTRAVGYNHVTKTEMVTGDDDVDISGAGPGQPTLDAVPPDTITPSMSHHDYISSLHIIKMEPAVPPPVQQEFGGEEGTAEEVYQMEMEVQDELLVVEEAAEEEITSHSLDATENLSEEEMVRSRPLTAMYLQRKEVSVNDSVYIPGAMQSRLALSPTKSPGSSTFRLKPSGRGIIEYGLLNGRDDSGMRHPYSDPISVYHPSTGEIELKSVPSDLADRRRKGQHKSVGAILAASEAIKHQDIASEVEIETCEIDTPSKQGGRKKKSSKKGGIDDDIETIKKAAKNVAYTLKGMSKPDKEGRRKKKPRIRLTLTKSKNRRNSSPSTYFSDDGEYESSSPVKIRKKRKIEQAEGEEMTNIIYQCEYCEKQFKTREKVRCHTKIHTEDRQYSCDECGSNYRRREHLVRHYRRHSNERPYKCLECDKAYMRAEHLKRHSFFHSGEKPFQCAECSKAFARHDRLLKHSLVHDK